MIHPSHSASEIPAGYLYHIVAVMSNIFSIGKLTFVNNVSQSKHPVFSQPNRDKPSLQDIFRIYETERNFSLDFIYHNVVVIQKHLSINLRVLRISCGKRTILIFA